MYRYCNYLTVNWYNLLHVFQHLKISLDKSLAFERIAEAPGLCVLMLQAKDAYGMAQVGVNTEIFKLTFRAEPARFHKNPGSERFSSIQ